MKKSELKSELARVAIAAKNRLQVREQSLEDLKRIQDQLQLMSADDEAFRLFLKLKEKLDPEVESKDGSARTVFFDLDWLGRDAAGGVMLVSLCKELGLKAGIHSERRQVRDWGPGPRVCKQWVEVVLPEMSSESP